MPELPEVETTRRGLATIMTGRKLRELLIHEARMRWPIPPELQQLVRDQTVLECARRGKYLLIYFENGVQIVHLGMSGSLRNVPMDAPLRKHDHVEWRFDDARFLLHDPRRFGAVLWHPNTAGPVLQHPLLAKLGVEPLGAEFTPELLYQGTRGRKQSIKQILLGGHLVVGVGNIYASEALYLAGIKPTIAGEKLSMPRCQRLHSAIISTLNKALEAGGSTLRDYVQADGSAGDYFSLHAAVYERAGQPCPQCANPIRRLVQGQRATYFCPVCQKR